MKIEHSSYILVQMSLVAAQLFIFGAVESFSVTGNIRQAEERGYRAMQVRQLSERNETLKRELDLRMGEAEQRYAPCTRQRPQDLHQRGLRV